MYFNYFNLQITTHVTAKPFLYNPKVITDFLSSASAASGNPGPSQNIADFTKNAHHPRPEKLQVDPKPADPENDDDFFKDVDLSPSEEPEMTNTQNEVLPGLLQKKVGKILRKIQLISSLSGNGNTPTTTSSESSDEDFDTAFNETIEEIADEDEKKEQVEIVTVANNNKQVVTEKPTNDAQSNFQASPGSFAVFLMELVGSIFGLAYGAAAQLTQGAKPN